MGGGWRRDIRIIKLPLTLKAHPQLFKPRTNGTQTAVGFLLKHSLKPGVSGSGETWVYVVAHH